jgi:hypothetical protein
MAGEFPYGLAGGSGYQRPLWLFRQLKWRNSQHVALVGPASGTEMDSHLARTNR